MTDLREAAQMALDALSMAVEPKKGKVYAFEFQPIDCAAMHLKAIEALRAALATEQDDGHCQACEGNYCTAKDGCVARDNPPQREWQGLTDEEIREIWGSYFSRGVEFARAIEAKLKEKNS